MMVIKMVVVEWRWCGDDSDEDGGDGKIIVLVECGDDEVVRNKMMVMMKKMI